MKLIKPRYESFELKIFRSLFYRTKLSENDLNYYSSILKGFEGEQKFDELLQMLSIEGLVLNDLLLEYNNTVFQIDSLLIMQEMIYLFDVKNFEGEYYMENGDWYTISGALTKNPLTLLKRCETSLRQLLQHYRYSLPIQPYLIFVNPNFHLFNAPRNEPMIFPGQIERFMNQLNKKPSRLKGHHNLIANKLTSIHLEESPYSRLPSYRYDELKKGVTCAGCGVFTEKFNKNNILCNECGVKEDVTSAILRSIKEFQLLFPDQKITTQNIHDWCRIFSKKTISRVLLKHFKQLGKARATYFV